MSAMKDVWDTLRAVASVIDKVAALSEDLRELRAENRQLRDDNQLLRERVIRIETIIDEARRNAGPRRLPRD
ncbi:hypothetical protein ACFONC_03295 [Luteimonas soli]|uniref:TIGR02449 family protein n=1 Tax=Luteimonas soli TaxID=1648966 RepID=A0ABV7XI63_9GAMM